MVNSQPRQKLEFVNLSEVYCLLSNICIFVNQAEANEYLSKLKEDEVADQAAQEAVVASAIDFLEELRCFCKQEIYFCAQNAPILQDSEEYLARYFAVQNS